MPGGPYTYPGVYVEEIPSGVHPIAGVSTSNTAFVDSFAKGPIDTPVKITSFEEFEETFGGLHPASEASYAILHYFMSGGSTAFVVRADGGTTKAKASAPTSANQPGPFTIEASSPGKWGDSVRFSIVQGTAPLWNLVVERMQGSDVVEREEHFGLRSDPAGPRYALSVVNQSSRLVRLGHVGTGGNPPATTRPDAAADRVLAGGVDNSAPTDATLKAAWGSLPSIAPQIFNLLSLPSAPANAAFKATLADAAEFCKDHRAFLIVDVPADTDTVAEAQTALGNAPVGVGRNAAMYFPRVLMADPLLPGQTKSVAPSGAIAGLYAATDAMRGVWKAPAGTGAGVGGVSLPIELDDSDNGDLNTVGINCLRTFPVYGTLVWGARTLDGADVKASEWKYVPVRRTALYIEESLATGLRWAVFEPNDEPLWSSIRLNVGAFMDDLYRQGAFAGSTPGEAYLVKCDKDTTRPLDQDRGVVNILVGFAPLKPAEFVVLKIQQLAGQSAA